jgi:hypothetical protein
VTRIKSLTPAKMAGMLQGSGLRKGFKQEALVLIPNKSHLVRNTPTISLAYRLVTYSVIQDQREVINQRR